MRDDALRADCERCFGLCCVAPAFAASADFAIDKGSGEPCPNLGGGFGCGIHERLRAEGFGGCVAYDCFGAGQKVAQVTFAGRDWRGAPRTAAVMFDAFSVMRQLHELLWYLAEALRSSPPDGLRAELTAASDEIERVTAQPADTLVALDAATYRDAVNPLLVRVSEMVRAATGGTGADHRGADLTGADLRGADLTGSSLRGARLIGADLRGADLTRADLTGADLRGADLAGADLGGSIFVTRSQIESARGDWRTRLPATIARPAHWPHP